MNITSSIENIQSLIKQGDSIDKGILLNNCLKQNIIVVILIWFIGCTIIGIPILFGIILYKGFCIGYTISAVIATTEFRKAISFIILSLLPQNIIIIPTILLITVSGIKLYKNRADKTYNDIFNSFSCYNNSIFYRSIYFNKFIIIF